MVLLPDVPLPEIKLVEVIDTARLCNTTTKRIRADKNRLPGGIVVKMRRRNALRRRHQRTREIFLKYAWSDLNDQIFH